jgi:hypothetical protein
MVVLGPTPEGRLIRQVRSLAIPKLSIPAAAARIDLSAEQWGYVERGYYPARDGNPARTFSPPAATLAKMAYALRITPEQLASEGQRPDAAEALREILLSEPPQPKVPPAASSRRHTEMTLEDDAEAIITMLAESVGDEVISGLLRFPDPSGPGLLPLATRLKFVRVWLEAEPGSEQLKQQMPPAASNRRNAAASKETGERDAG